MISVIYPTGVRVDFEEASFYKVIFDENAVRGFDIYNDATKSVLIAAIVSGPGMMIVNGKQKVKITK